MWRPARAASSTRGRSPIAGGARRWSRAIVWPEEGSMPESMGRKFRRLLKEEPYLFTGGVYEPLGAQIAERVGMKSIYLSGYSMALHNAWPDMGFLTQTEVARIASMVASATSLPVIADADDGYGNALSTIRPVAEVIKAGAAGIHREDHPFTSE